jgi:small-conductance mechanosensitive channel
MIARFRRALVALIAFGGLYAAVAVAPLPARLDRWLSGFLYIAAAYVAALLTSQVVALLVATSLARVADGERERLQREYVPLVGKLTSLAAILILVTVVAKHFGEDVTSLVAALGVGSLAIGLAAQQTIGNMIAGFVLLVDRPFRPGDRIKLASGESGEVMEVGVRSTRILMLDKNLLIVPNTELANSRVVKYTYPTPAGRGEVKVVIAFGSDVERATAAVRRAIAAEERAAHEPSPLVRLAALGPNGLELTAAFDVARHQDVLTVEEAVRRRILTELSHAGIELANLRQDVRILERA